MVRPLYPITLLDYIISEVMLMLTRYSEETEKHYRRAVLRDKGKERMYFYPPDTEDPSPMYEGLRTNLPNVSSTYIQ